MRKRYCFLICPMSPNGGATRSKELKEKILAPAFEDLRREPDGADFEILDFLDDPDRNLAIRSRIRDYIETAEVCIADLSDFNANVAFEYGCRLTTGHPVFPMRQKGANLAFNFDDYQTREYDLGDPRPTIEALKSFIKRHCLLGNRVFDISSDRTTQTDRICRYIKEHRPQKIDIIHVSLLALRDRLLDAVFELDHRTTIRLLLMHPDAGGNYAVPTQKMYVGYTEWFIEQLAATRRTKGLSCSPTMGIWFYRHEPSVAAVIVDDSLLQLGWYFRSPSFFEPEEKNRRKLIMQGHDQPSVLLMGPHGDPDLARRQNWTQTFGKARAHFESVLRLADEPAPGHISGPRADEVRSEWRKLKERTSEPCSGGDCPAARA